MKTANRPPSVKDLKSTRLADVVPPGWFSRAECEKEWNLSSTHTYKLIREALMNDRAISKKFLVLTPMRGLYPTPYYKFKSGG